MTRDDIIRMTKEAGFHVMQGSKGMLYAFSYQHMEKFANLVAAAEREACAKLLDDLAAKDKLSNYHKVAALAIRERGAP